jgi:hypothetical protein
VCEHWWRLLAAAGSTGADARRGRPRFSLSAHRPGSVAAAPAAAPQFRAAAPVQPECRLSLRRSSVALRCAGLLRRSCCAGQCRSLPAYHGSDSESAVTVGPTPGRGRIDPRDGRERIEPRCSLRRGGSGSARRRLAGCSPVSVRVRQSRRAPESRYLPVTLLSRYLSHGTVPSCHDA